MKLTYFLFGYILLVTAVIAAHVFIAVFLKNYDKGLDRRRRYWNVIISRCISSGSFVMRAREVRKLKNARMLAAFYEAYHQQLAECPETSQLITENHQQILRVGEKLRSSTMKAYFAYMISTFGFVDAALNSGFDKLMLEYLKGDSVYLRENALKALYSFGQVDPVVGGLLLLSRGGVYHSEKLLGDGLLSFAGDKKQLAEALMERFGELSECCGISVVNFLRYCGYSDYDQQLIAVLSETGSTDLKCSIIRLLGRTADVSNRKAILDSLAEYDSDDGWEPAAVAVSVLTIYRDEEVMAALLRSLHSRNWYVRINAAKSLARTSVPKKYIDEIMSGEDRYAREELSYELTRLKAGGEDA
jgi:hypothetical protein